MRSSPGKGFSTPPLKKYVTCAYFSVSATRRFRSVDVRHHVGKDVVERFRRDNVRQRELGIVLRHANIFQVLRHTCARDDGIESLGIGKIAAGIGGHTAIAAQRSSDFANAIGAKVEADTRVVVANRRQRLALVVGADKRHNELIGYTLVVRIFYSLHRIDKARSTAVAGYHHVESFGHTIPALIAIHGVVAAGNRCDFARHRIRASSAGVAQRIRRRCSEAYRVRP